jgi:murein DD-endopeptidase MepM/ murein hydrolase activator NlpD
VPYALSQGERLRAGVGAIAGNHVIIAAHGVFIALVHLKRSSLRVSIGDRVTVGQRLADCGNSGNSTQPHVHVQAMDSRDLTDARGIPITFRMFREQPARGRAFEIRDYAMPREGAVVEPAEP